MRAAGGGLGTMIGTMRGRQCEGGQLFFFFLISVPHLLVIYLLDRGRSLRDIRSPVPELPAGSLDQFRLNYFVALTVIGFIIDPFFQTEARDFFEYRLVGIFPVESPAFPAPLHPECFEERVFILVRVFSPHVNGAHLSPPLRCHRAEDVKMRLSKMRHDIRIGGGCQGEKWRRVRRRLSDGAFACVRGAGAERDYVYGIDPEIRLACVDDPDIHAIALGHFEIELYRTKKAALAKIRKGKIA